MTKQKPGSAKRKRRSGVALPDAEADGRTRVAKRFKALIAAFAEDLGSGQLSHADQALVRQAAAMVVRAEQTQAAMLMGKTITDEDLVRLTNAAARILNMLGAQRIKRKPVHIPLRERLVMERDQGQQS
jgi:hypothetical protein